MTNAPRTIHDPILGTLTEFASLPGCFAGTVTIAERKIGVSLHAQDRPMAALVSRATQIVQALDDYAARAAEFAGSELAELATDWADDLHVEVSPTDLMHALTLLDIAVDDAQVTFEFDDGNLFLGHRVKVTMDPADRFVSAEI